MKSGNQKLCLLGVCALVLMTLSQAFGADMPGTLDMSIVRAVPVQHDGRWPPLDTVARDIVESVTGDMNFEGNDPVLLLLAWTFDSQNWTNHPLITIKNPDLRKELGLSVSKAVYSYNELIGHARFMALIEELSRVSSGTKLNPLQSKVRDIEEQLVVLQSVYQGRVIKAIPDAKDVNGTWQPIRALSAKHKHDESHGDHAVQNLWGDLKKSFLADDGPAFAEGSSQLAAALGALPAAYRPSQKLIETELHYNKLRPFRLAWHVMLIGFVLAVVAVAVRRKWFDVIAILGLIAGFGVLTYGLSLRWQIAGRIPAANMFESLLFLSWGMGAFAIVSFIFLRHRIVPLTASGMGALSLILADCLLEHFIRPIAPVLMDTVWMSIHVPVIMVSYSVLALAGVFAHFQLATMAVAPTKRQLIDTIDTLHYWYVFIGSFLLGVGIITGSMWAASSWGRYWGWDPKEVWSLVAFLAYIVILHVRIDRQKIPPWAYAAGAVLILGTCVFLMPKFAPVSVTKLLLLAGVVAATALFIGVRGKFATALKSVLAFWMILMTYIGVNYVLGVGLHAYAFGTGAVARYMILIGGIDLALVLVCGLVYLLNPERRAANG